MRIPDWLIYLVVLTAVLYAVLSRSESVDAPVPPPQVSERDGMVLPGPSVFDEAVTVNVDAPRDGIGTAFSIGSEGLWLSAKHVIDGCEEVGLEVGRGRIAPVLRYETFEAGDLALLYTSRAPQPSPLNLSAELTIGEKGYHFGFPQGRPGEATSRLLARSRLITRGRYTGEEPVLAWAEAGRTRGLDGSLGGMSGGPVFNEAGQVIGVTVAESARRGRIYTAAPRSIDNFLGTQADLPTDGKDARPINQITYGTEADRLRRNLSIVKVVCRAAK